MALEFISPRVNQILTLDSSLHLVCRERYLLQLLETKNIPVRRIYEFRGNHPRPN